MTELDWNNLLINRCPSCGELFPQQEDEDRVCDNHQGRPFKIPGFKFVKICRDLENRDDMKMPRFE
jgi:hypothetical protein